MLKLEKVSKDYGNGKGVKNISFQISRGKVCALLGHNGCGKTTTFRLLLGLLKEDEGYIYYDKEILDRFVREKYSLGGAIKKATYKGQIRRSKAADFVVRVMFVLGKKKKKKDKKRK